MTILHRVSTNNSGLFCLCESMKGHSVRHEVVGGDLGGVWVNWSSEVDWVAMPILRVGRSYYGVALNRY